MAGLFRAPDLQTGHVKSWQFGVRAFDGERAEWRRQRVIDDSNRNTTTTATTLDLMGSRSVIANFFLCRSF